MSQLNDETISETEEFSGAVTATTGGRIAFIGVDPNSADFLTLAGARALREADLLITTKPLRAVLDDAGVELPTREDTHFLAELPDVVDFEVKSASEGRSVARLVAGDPLIEAGIAGEAQACARAGCPIDIVPGVPMLTATPTLAGVSFPGHAVQLVAVPDDAHMVDLPAQGSVTLSCGPSQLPGVVAGAVQAGRAKDEPVLVTTGAATPRQHSVLATLGKVEKVAREQAVDDEPIFLVLGPAAERDEALDWYESKPLFGWRVLVPRTGADCRRLVERLRLHGAVSEEVATISVEPPRNPQQLDKAVRGMVDGRYEWVVFTSAHAVRAVFGKLEEYGLDSRALSGLRIATVGADTASALHTWGIAPDLSPSTVQTVAGLAGEFPAYDEVLDPINKVFVPRADIATEPLAVGLTELGWEVDDVTAYRTVRAAPPPLETREAIKSGRFDAVAFTSSTTVRNLVGIAGKPHAQTLVVAIGPATVEACEEHGLRVDAMAPRPGQIELADALAEMARRRRDALAAAGQTVTRPSAKRRRRASH
ncbi:uroporphyrinogen III methyltransferase / synthase [Propionibacterium cyclohexanicum]|uniref:Uroporphyrinogen III methyltransferase / synthase n=1 Tax=Propionibacterium cyclohexanicum TaxID=64702 RepID=A0A1H9RU73_9ACTN|nr:uroporphyrinogen-III synthase [Propionibacterium cyclohexanicum]SER76098.1 uroporphyrinogen III methyltransferase / synthase [Propionibacterium cyclohexanicum]